MLASDPTLERWVATAAAPFVGESGRRGTMTALVGWLGVATALFHLSQVHAYWLPGGVFKSVHLALALLLSLVGLIEATPRERRRARRGLAALALLCLVPLAYIPLEYDALVADRSFLPNTADLVVAVLLLALALFVAVREWGWIIPTIAVAGIVYGKIGPWLPGDLLFHAGMSWERLVGYTSIPYFRGLLGSLTAVSANTIFIYMLFAGLLRSTGGLDFLMKVAFALSGRSRAGPAQAAVVGSGFMGMISGSTMANVASTGAFTIPLMKRFGFRAPFAGAVESVASAGGQVTPPKMGLAAFLIVGLTGIPYAEVMAAAIFPALIYYGYLLLAVHIQAVRLDLGGRGTAARLEGLPLADMPLAKAALLYGHPILAVALLIWLLLEGLPANTAALYAIFLVIAVEITKQVGLLIARPVALVGTLARTVLRGLAEGARGGAQVAVVVAVISVMVEMLVATGFAQKLSYLALDLAGGKLWALLLLTAISCLGFGVGMPTSAAYILVALLGVPALVEVGIPILAAHLYVFYLANMSAITPPVAVGCLVAANIAKAPFFRTAFTAVRLGLPGFLLPFMFVLHPEILGLGTDFATQLAFAALAGVALVSVNIAFEGYLFARLHPLERALLLPAAFGLFWPDLWATFLGLGLFVVVAARQWLARERPPATTTAEMRG